MRLAPPPDWRPPQKLLVIAASPRSGSSMLGVVVASTGSLGVPHEWLHAEVPLPTRAPTGTVTDRCRLLVAAGGTPNGVVGVRMFGLYFARTWAEIDFPRWFPDVSWVWLRRRNLVRQAVSFALAARSGNWTSLDQGPARSSYASASLRRYLRTLLLHDGIWKSHFRAHGIVPLSLWYEDIVDRLEDTVRAIAAHAGVPLVNQSDRTQLKLERQSDAENERWVARFMAEPGNRQLIARLNAARGIPSGPAD